MKKASKSFWKISYGAMMTVALAAVFCLSVYALPADSETVYATKSGRVWHEFRNCEDLVGYDAWAMTFADYRKAKNNTTECSKCKNGQELTGDVIGKTYLYQGSYVRKTEIFPELLVGYSGDFKRIGSGEETTSASDTTTSDANTDTTAGAEESSSQSTDTSKNTTTKNTTTKNTTTKNSTTKSSTSKTTASSGNASNSSSSGSSSGKDLMTEKQRRKKFLSKTNPKRGAVVTTPARPKSVGFSYADFSTYNDYSFNNGRGREFVYLLGTIMTMEPVRENGNIYGVAMMVNDCDGYQWYMRYDCAKDKYALLKAELTGKQAYIYGTSAGYSGVTNRPMMDALTVLETNGRGLDLRLFK